MLLCGTVAQAVNDIMNNGWHSSVLHLPWLQPDAVLACGGLIWWYMAVTSLFCRWKHFKESHGHALITYTLEFCLRFFFFFNNRLGLKKKEEIIHSRTGQATAFASFLVKETKRPSKKIKMYLFCTIILLVLLYVMKTCMVKVFQLQYFKCIFQTSRCTVDINQHNEVNLKKSAMSPFLPKQGVFSEKQAPTWIGCVGQSQ